MEQHFLRNRTKIKALLGAAAVRPDERVVELGAGIGSVARHIPPCRSLTLVELDPALARDLAAAFPYGQVIQADAVVTLPALTFDVLLTNLPHYLTPAALEILAAMPFRVAVLAVRADVELAVPPVLRATEVVPLHATDFTPTQPFASRVIRVVRSPATGNG